MAISFSIGKGTKAFVALLPLGDRTEPQEVTLTSTNSISAKDTTSPATITLSAALGAGVKIAAGNYLNFVAPTTGKEVLVQLTEDAEAGDTDITVNIIPEAIAASSVAQFPPRLRARTAANLDRSGNRVTSVSFEDGGFEDGLVSSISQSISLPGNWAALDGGFSTCEYAFTQLREIYLWLELPRISDAYSKGRVYHGPASIESLPLEIPADGVITGEISANFNGEANYDPDTPV